MEFPEVDSTNDMMCLAHITDPHLLAKVEDQAVDEGVCFVCRDDNRVQQGGPVVNLEPVAEATLDAIQRSYDTEGFVIDSHQVATEHESEDVTYMVLEDAIEAQALDLVVGYILQLISISPYVWYEPFFDPNDDREHQWQTFEQSVKHETRLLTPPPPGVHPRTAPERNHEFISSLLVWADQFSIHLDAGTALYRARIERDAQTLKKNIEKMPASQLGPAPKERAAAGRMNAQGIPMFYVALDASTACAEVATHSPYSEAVVGRFDLQVPLRILDLTQMPPAPSPFEDEVDDWHFNLEALSFYVEQITRPVIMDGNHPVDYVAPQLLTEAFRWRTDPALDGIMYPSRVSEGGKNVVLFFGNDLWLDETGYSEPEGMRRLNREQERNRTDPLFVIDPASVAVKRMKRSITVDW